MAEIENMTGTAGSLAEYVAGSLDHTRARTQQHRWVEVALDAAIVANATPPFVEADAPVQRDDVRAGRSDELEKPGGRGSEVDSRHPQRACGFENAPREGQHPRLIVRRR